LNTSLMVKSALVAALTAATALIAKIELPFTQVPLTLQVFFSLLAGAILGPRYGALSMVLYVLMGAIGLPVFAGGKSGLGVLLGPTGGYLFGFIAAAYLVGLITSRGKGTTAQLGTAMLAGIAVIYALGVLQLSVVAKLSLVKAFAIGAAPFIAVDIIKGLAAVVVARRLRVVSGS